MNYEAIAFWAQIFGFVAFVAFMVWAWGKWLTPAIAEAARQSNERIALAERHRDEMNAAVETLKAELEGARRDAQTAKERAADRAVYERDAILADAKEQGDRALKNAGGELDRLRVEARAKMREQLAERALEIARAQAQSRVGADTNRSLIESFVHSLEHGARN